MTRGLSLTRRAGTASRRSLVVTATLIGVIVVGGAAYPAPGAAMPATAARPQEYSVLNAVSCTDPANCVAVGDTSKAGSYLQFAARWDGTGWTQLPSPSGPSTATGMTAVSCPSDEMCMAVDAQGGMLEWDGSSWQAPSGSIGGVLSAVSCASTVSCVAVGFGGLTPSLGAGVWNGQAWTEHDPAAPPGTVQASLDGVWCISASDCIAVGGYTTDVHGNDTALPLAERWNGQSWSQLSVPAPSVAVQAINLASISCAGSGSCVAVGDMNVNTDDEGVAYAWDGTSWAAMPQPAGIPASVSCWSASGCATTDQVGFGAGGTAIPELWDGSSWAQLHPPVPSPQPSALNAVSCYGPAACLFVGTAAGSRPLALSWAGGQWQLDRVVPRDGFAGVWCTGTASCVAAGGYIDTGDDMATLAADWNGTSWQQLTTPAVSGTLTDISCDGPGFCMAVGRRASRDRPLAERWDGQSWQVLPTSFSGNPQQIQPVAVSCADGRCLAVTESRYYALWWNGTSWRLIRNVPIPRTSDLVQFTDVSCASAGYCIAAGTVHRRSGHFTSFADLWDGTRFRLLSAPGNGLASISCLSTTFCLGVTTNSAVIWNGSSWLVRRLPGFFGRPGLAAVSCASQRICMAVGNYVAKGVTGNTVAFLTGTTWRRLPSPAPDTVLTDVSCAGRLPRCIVVGEGYDGPAATQTFTAVWTGSDWLPYPAPNP